MSKVIIDSSTLCSFYGLVSGRINIQRLNHEDHSKDAYEIIENVIEALLLYDEVYFDKDTVENDLGYSSPFPLLQLSHCSLVSSCHGTIGEYKHILHNLNIPASKVEAIARVIESDWESFMDPHGNYGCMILNPKDAYYDNLCRDFINKYSSSLTSRDELIDRTVFYSIVRFLYYQRLCVENDAELVIHPNRGILSLSLSGYKKLFQTSQIFKNFESVADSQAYRFAQWIPVNYNVLRLPLVANYVIQHVNWKSIDSFLDSINTLRNQTEIKEFRDGFNEFLSLIERCDVSGLSKIIEDLDKAVKYWSSSLHGEPNKYERIVTMSQTNYNASMNFGFASLGVGQSYNIETKEIVDENSPTSSKMLTLIHDTLNYSVSSILK